MTFVLLLIAGLIGGALNSLAGGGSFIVFPALLLAGVPPVSANTTNTFAALPGYVTGFAGYWRHLLAHRGRLLLYGAIGLVGGWIGAEVLLRVSNEQFEAVIPWLMGFAVLAFAFGGRAAAWFAARAAGRRGMAAAGLAGLSLLLLAISIYGGFFNAGLGIILLAFLALAGMTDIHAMNGVKLMISTLVALVAAIRFALGDAIVWAEGFVCIAGTMTGGFLAARFAHHVPTPWLRGGIIAYGMLLTGFFFWRAYGG